MLFANCSRDCDGRLASNCFDAWANVGFIASSHTAAQSTETILLLKSIVRFLYNGS